jgi:hypothetical protein
MCFVTTLNILFLIELSSSTLEYVRYIPMTSDVNADPSLQLYWSVYLCMPLLQQAANKKTRSYG